MAKHHSGKDYVDEARRHGLRVENGRGDHAKVYSDDGRMMVVPLHRELATGTEHTIRKWFKMLGILLVLNACGVLMYLTYF